MGDTTPNNNAACFIHPQKRPGRHPPRSHCPQPVSRDDRVGWEGLGAPRSLPKGKLRARPVTSGSQRSLVAPQDASLLPSGCSRLKDPEPSGKGGRRVVEPQPAPLPSLTWDGPSTQGGLLLSPQLLSASPSAGTLPGTVRVPRARGASPRHPPPVGRGKAQAASRIWANQSPRRSVSSFPLGVSSGGTVLGWAGRAAQEAAGVRPSQLAHLCSPAGLGGVQGRLKSHKPDSSPRMTALGPLAGHLCSIFLAVSKTRNLPFKLKLSPDCRSFGFERWP